MPTDDEQLSSSARWLTSWKPSAVILVLFCLPLIQVLQSSVPWSALAFPGIVIAISGLHIVSHFTGWDKRPLLASLPLVVYVVLTTVTMLAFFVSTGEPYYQKSALVSIAFLVPLGAMGLFLLRTRNDPRWPRYPPD